MPRISQTNRYIVQGALHDGKTPAQIAKMTGLTEQVVSNYISGELDKLHTTIAKVQTEQVIKEAAYDPIPKPEPDPRTPPPVAPTKLPRNYSKGQFALKPADKKSSTNDGYAIMTPNAAAAGDDFLKQMPKTISRTARNNLYRADTGEQIDNGQGTDK